MPRCMGAAWIVQRRRSGNIAYFQSSLPQGSWASLLYRGEVDGVAGPAAESGRQNQVLLFVDSAEREGPPPWWKPAFTLTGKSTDLPPRWPRPRTAAQAGPNAIRRGNPQG